MLFDDDESSSGWLEALDDDIDNISNVESCGQASHENLDTELLSKMFCKQIYKKEGNKLHQQSKY
jgi:hypothetical protein